MTDTKKPRHNFGTMDSQRQREIASMGGRAAHRSGRAREFTSEEAREAAKKGHEMRAARKAKP